MAAQKPAVLYFSCVFFCFLQESELTFYQLSLYQLYSHHSFFSVLLPKQHVCTYHYHETVMLSLDPGQLPATARPKLETTNAQPHSLATIETPMRLLTDVLSQQHLKLIVRRKFTYYQTLNL